VNSIEELADRILKDAVAKQASDIHIIPRKHDTLIQFRLAQRLVTRLSLPIVECDRLISHFKFTASMDIGEKRRPQNGAYSIQVAEKQIGLRLSTLPGNKKESLVIRLLPQHQSIPSYQVSLFPNTTNKLFTLLKHAHGLIILTGPTGSGKTTTLYSLLDKSSDGRNVITLEDPIEKESEGVLQVQVNEKAGISYSTGLKAILRHDPDIIMVGEIRDSETAKTAVRAALTGHLVLSTMHTRDAKGAIYRLLEFGVDWIEIEQTLVAVTAQRIVELSCAFYGVDCSHANACYICENAKRACVFEILTGQSLSGVINEARGSKEKKYDYLTLGRVIAKGIALGFIKETEYERWVIDRENEE